MEEHDVQVPMDEAPQRLDDKHIESTPMIEKDPVCGMNIDPATTKHTHSYGDKNYYFCCASCVDKFKADPTKYLANATGGTSSGLVTLGAAPSRHVPIPAVKAKNSPLYVCPMCPEVHEAKPGACPSCGMALEPDVPRAATRNE